MESRVKTFKFKKIDWHGRGRKINQPEVTMTLRYYEEDRPCLTIYGTIWNCHHTDATCSGQCLDEMAKYDSLVNDPTFNKLFYLHQNYHLNDCRAGTPSQLDAIKAFHIANKEKGIVNLNGFDADVEYLKSIDLYEDNGHTYGSKWFYMEIPDDDMNTINELFSME